LTHEIEPLRSIRGSKAFRVDDFDLAKVCAPAADDPNNNHVSVKLPYRRLSAGETLQYPNCVHVKDKLAFVV
jgi:hypothetical protein